MWNDPSFHVTSAAKDVANLKEGESLHSVSIHALWNDVILKKRKEDFKVDINADDVRQMQIGDCWLLSALATIAERRPDKIDQLCLWNNNVAGWSCIRFPSCFIYVDHFIPVVAKNRKIIRLLGPNITSQKEIWPIVLEKAIVKLFASQYVHREIGAFCQRRREMKGVLPLGPNLIDIDGGFPRWVFMSVFGVDMSPLSTTAQIKPWSIILSDEDVLACACTSSEHTDDVQSEGFVYGHAYSILGANPETGLIRVRNPWAKYESKIYDDGVDDGSFFVDEKTFRRRFPIVALLKVR